MATLQQTHLEHPDEEALERFLLNMSPDEEREILETHVLACESCLDQLDALEIDIAATRLALSKLEEHSVQAKAEIPAERRFDLDEKQTEF